MSNASRIYKEECRESNESLRNWYFSDAHGNYVEKPAYIPTKQMSSKAYRIHRRHQRRQFNQLRKQALNEFSRNNMSFKEMNATQGSTRYCTLHYWEFSKVRKNGKLHHI